MRRIAWRSVAGFVSRVQSRPVTYPSWSRGPYVRRSAARAAGQSARSTNSPTPSTAGPFVRGPLE
jgi:hypothetical protein